jgi:hypothetical protein
MRGWLSLLTTDSDPANYHTGLFVASAELDIIRKVRPVLVRRWPAVEFTCLAPQGFAHEFCSEAKVLWLEQLKLHPFRALLALRRSKFDLCVVLFTARPTFRKVKLSTFWLNTRRTVLYNENGDSIVIDRAHWKQLLALVAYRLKVWPLSLFYPLGFLYLGIRTLWLITRSKFTGRKA